ncbi:putative membrane protein [Sphingobacterium nematocida]|uniref:Putative membrane protein n=1 Tax=Sphingobacterium nematocida TaxID=1513896 RepID=A0A1T5ASE3_9SPHI|nr:DUF4142 domain-containing protein [Sphingobacterium nematocida]SKB37779.1 putative membrane protein [Sphingobacterium nematocida]
MKKYLNWTVVILGIITFMSFGQQNAEQDFVNKAIMANQYEIALAQQAAERSSNESIKAYAQMLAEDHQKVSSELQKYAESKGWTVSMELGSTHKDLLGTLDGTDSSAYDHAFREAAIASHEQTIAMYEDAHGGGTLTDENLKTWIADTLPSLKAHLGEARELKMEKVEPMNNKIPTTLPRVNKNKS